MVSLHLHVFTQPRPKADIPGVFAVVLINPASVAGSADNTARQIAWARRSTPSLAKMLFTWDVTVSGVIPSERAISLLDRPWPINSRILRSRRLNESTGNGRRPGQSREEAWRRPGSGFSRGRWLGRGLPRLVAQGTGRSFSREGAVRPPPPLLSHLHEGAPSWR
jgi:hypothetical protein